MNKLFPALLAASFFLNSALALALSPPAPEDFAYGLELDVSGADAFYELELPLYVYQTVTRGDLGDLRVFNGNGNVVPHALRKANRTISRKDTVATTLPFFPIFARPDSNPDEISIHVNKSSDGTIIDVNTADKQNREAEKTIVSYLIDATPLKNKNIYALELAWEDGQEGFMGRIDVQSSQDLHTWRNAATATIARLNYLGAFLDRRKIEMNNTGTPYLRLSWPAGQPPIKLTRVVVLTRTISTSHTPSKQYLKLNASPVLDKPGEYLIDLKGPLPAETIKISLQEKNSLANITLYSSRSEDNSNSRRQWQGMVYNIDYKGNSLSSPPININSKDRYWTISIDKSENSINLPPIVEFSWQPDRLVFLAQGESPYLLAYGNATLEPANFQVGSLLEKYRGMPGAGINPKLISAGPKIILGGPNCLQALPPSLPWRKYILWAILCGGVMLIGLMSTSLYRQLQKQNAN